MTRLPSKMFRAFAGLVDDPSRGAFRCGCCGLQLPIELIEGSDGDGSTLCRACACDGGQWAEQVRFLLHEGAFAGWSQKRIADHLSSAWKRFTKTRRALP